MKQQESSPTVANNNSSLLSPIFNLFGIVGLSLPAHLIITPAINVGGKKVKENTNYKTALKEAIARPVGIQLQDTTRIMQRRILASMLPAVASKQIAQEFELPISGLMPLNAIFETVIGSWLEPKEKFSSVNSSKYPLIHPLQPGQLISNPANILQVTRDQFFALTPNHPTTKNYGEHEWQDLHNRQNIFKQNYSERAAALFCRNLSFCGASVVAGPLATKFVNQNKDKIEQAGINITHADYAATVLCRMFFAWMTTPFDSLATRLSAGDLTAKEVMLEMTQNIKARNVSSFFAGAAARTILATTTSSTVALGAKAGKYLEEFAENIADGIEQNPFYKLLISAPDKVHTTTISEASQYASHLITRIINRETTVSSSKEIIESINKLPDEDKVHQTISESEKSLQNFAKNIAPQLSEQPASNPKNAKHSTLQKKNESHEH